MATTILRRAAAVGRTPAFLGMSTPGPTQSHKRRRRTPSGNGEESLCTNVLTNGAPPYPHVSRRHLTSPPAPPARPHSTLSPSSPHMGGLGESSESCRTPRALAANLFLSYGEVADNGQVTLDKKSLGQLMKCMGMVMSDQRLQEMTTMADTNKDGVICEDDFWLAFNWLLEEGQTNRDYVAMFNCLDMDKNGFIEVEELTRQFTTNKQRISVEEARDIITVADRDGDGRLSFPEFLDLMTNNSVLGWRLLTTFRVVFVVGGPASGKGTVCAEMVKASGGSLLHVSSGDLLRKEVREQTPLGIQVEEDMKQGRLAEASTVLALMDKFLGQNPGKVVMLDGFPRSLHNARDFTNLFGHADGLIHFDCPDQEMLSRILERGKTSGRADDLDVETARARIATFHTQSAGPMRYFESVGLPRYRLDACDPLDMKVKYLMDLPLFKNICYQHHLVEEAGIGTEKDKAA